MKKKILVVFIAFVAAFSCLAFTACGDSDEENNNYSETFEGALSDDSYATKELAANAFFANEIDSEETPAEFVSYTSVRQYTTEEEIATLSLPESALTDLISVEEGLVAYTTNSVAYSSAAVKAKTQTVYILEYDVSASAASIKYLTPLPKKGETLSKSYYQSVFDPAQYINCTSVYKIPVKVRLKYQGFSINTEITLTTTTRCAENAIEIISTTEMPYYDEYSGRTTYATVSFSSYLVDSDDGILLATDESGEWQVENLTQTTGFKYLSELYDLNLPDADFSYLEKTDTGFKMKEEFVQGIMEDIIYEAGIQNYLEPDFGFSVSANYYVTEGKLDNIKVNLSLSSYFYAEGYKYNVNISVNAVNKYSNFGTTTVTIPDGAKEALNIQ